MKTQSRILLSYKGRVLLITKEIPTQNVNNIWDFIRIVKSDDIYVLDFLNREVNLKAIINDENYKLMKISLKINGGTSYLFHMRLTDENVNSIKRKSGWRMEFYQLKELDKMLLTDEARQIYLHHHAEISALLS